MHHYNNQQMEYQSNRIIDSDTVFKKPCSLYCVCSNPNCKAREKDEVHEWRWDSKFADTTIELSGQDLEVKFHPIFSAGTAVVKGNSLMQKGRHHFWEIKMLTAVYGTDVMVGLGTDKVDVTSMTETYCSLLGRDKESWGFSYMGYIQHDGKIRTYSHGFKQGSTVGIHLDTWKGTLQFFLDRKPLGIAFTGLQDVPLYPMACSTAAKSKMKLTYSCSIPSSLQIDCLAMLTPFEKAYLKAAFPGLNHLSRSVFSDILQKDSDGAEECEFDFTGDFAMLDDMDHAVLRFSKRSNQNR